jgi:hypothetical protein
VQTLCCMAGGAAQDGYHIDPAFLLCVCACIRLAGVSTPAHMCALGRYVLLQAPVTGTGLGQLLTVCGLCVRDAAEGWLMCIGGPRHALLLLFCPYGAGVE